MTKIRQKFITRITMLFAILSIAACSGGHWSIASPRNNFLQGSYQYTYQPLLILANQNVAEAQYALGYLFFYGKGVHYDPLRAKQWIDKAKTQHYGPAIKAEEIISTTTHHDTKLPYPPVLRTLYTQNSNTHEDPVKSPWNYIIQLGSTYDKEHLSKLAKKYGIANDTRIYEVQLTGGKWYILSYGGYGTSVQVITTIKNLPSELMPLHPWPRPMGTLRPIAASYKVTP